MEPEKERIIDFAKRVYEAKGQTPSVRKITSKFRMSLVKFYATFPGGVTELCDLAGIPAPEDRIRAVERALSVRRPLRPTLERGEADVRARLKEARSAFERLKSDYKDQVELLKLEATMKPQKIPDYVREVLPKRNPGLWQKLLLLAGDSMDNVILEAVSGRPAYAERIKEVIAGGRKVCDFGRYVEEALEEWLRRAIQMRLCSRARPGLASNKCPACGRSLEYREGKEYSILCPTCKKTWIFNCPICGANMKLSPSVLACANCGYKYVFKDSLLPEITVKYAASCKYSGIKDPRLKGKSLVLLKEMPDGSEKVIWVAHKW